MKRFVVSLWGECGSFLWSGDEPEQRPPVCKVHRRDCQKEEPSQSCVITYPCEWTNKKGNIVRQKQGDNHQTSPTSLSWNGACRCFKRPFGFEFTGDLRPCKCWTTIAIPTRWCRRCLMVVPQPLTDNDLLLNVTSLTRDGSAQPRCSQQISRDATALAPPNIVQSCFSPKRLSKAVCFQ